MTEEDLLLEEIGRKIREWVSSYQNKKTEIYLAVSAIFLLVVLAMATFFAIKGWHIFVLLVSAAFLALVADVAACAVISIFPKKELRHKIDSLFMDSRKKTPKNGIKKILTTLAIEDPDLESMFSSCLLGEGD